MKRIDRKIKRRQASNKLLSDAHMTGPSSYNDRWLTSEYLCSQEKSEVKDIKYSCESKNATRSLGYCSCMDFNVNSIQSAVLSKSISFSCPLQLQSQKTEKSLVDRE